MKLKSYFSGTVEAAMELALQELGEDALLIHARPATPETRALGALEVVFGIPPGNTRSAAFSMERRSAAPRNAVDAGVVDTGAPDMRAEVASLKRELERLAESLRGPRAVALHPLPEQQAIREQWLDAGFEADLADKVARGVDVEDLFAVDATLGRRDAARRIAVLVGPPGAGKTTALIKLAAQYGLAARRPAHILSVDVYRIAAADQLRSLASILGIGCTIAETPLALKQALEEHAAKDLLLVDTPGFGPRDIDSAADLARSIGGHPEMDVHLTLPATLRPADLSRAVDRFEPFRPGKLLFTHIDEASGCGALINESARRALPVSFLCTGQLIPDDIEPATKARLAALAGGTVAEPGKTAGAAA
jgi:flagellar biosynthesis protein FlhF